MDSRAIFERLRGFRRVVLKRGPQSHFGPDHAAMVQTCRATKRLAMTTVNRGLSMAALAAALAFSRLSPREEKRRAAMGSDRLFQRPQAPVPQGGQQQGQQGPGQQHVARPADHRPGAGRRPIRFCGSSGSTAAPADDRPGRAAGVPQPAARSADPRHGRARPAVRVGAQGGPGAQGPGGQLQQPPQLATTDRADGWTTAAAIARTPPRAQLRCRLLRRLRLVRPAAPRCVRSVAESNAPGAPHTLGGLSGSWRCRAAGP